MASQNRGSGGSQIPFRPLLVAGSLQGRSKRVMDGGISRRQTHRHTQRRNCVFVSLDGDKTRPPAQVGFREIGIELCGLGESGDGLIPFLVPPGKFSQDVVGTCIIGVNLNVLSGIPASRVPRRRAGIRPARATACRAKVNAGSIRLLFDHAFIFKLSRFPLPLHFECFSVQFYEQQVIAAPCGQGPGPFASINRSRHGPG